MYQTHYICLIRVQYKLDQYESHPSINRLKIISNSNLIRLFIVSLV